MMSDSEELTKLIDSSYKNILDKFNPSARHLIAAGKTYLKALNATSTAAKGYVQAVVRLARNAQQATWSGATDVGAALMQMVDVYHEVQTHQMNVLKAFYVDLLLPLETNLEKDTKVVQTEQKKFLQQHKSRQEAYVKAAAAVKKLRKKSRSGQLSATLDKELRIQTLEDERSRLDAFCEISLRSAITQERRRYGFVLERQCSLAKHYLAYHTQGQKLFQERLNRWQEVANSRERLPPNVEGMFPSRLQDEDRQGSLAAVLRKTKSMDVSCVDLRTAPATTTLARAKSDFDLSASHPSLGPERNLTEGSFQHFSLESGPDWWCGLGEMPARPCSIAVADEPLRRHRARALYSYLSSGVHQLSFHEGDLIALIGQRNKGWQYGENLRSHRCGWFPVAYTEMVPFDELDEASCSSSHHGYSLDIVEEQIPNCDSMDRRPHSMFVDSVPSRPSSKMGQTSFQLQQSCADMSLLVPSQESDRSSSGQEEGDTPPLPNVIPRQGMMRRVGRSFTSPVPLLVAARPSVGEAGDLVVLTVHGTDDKDVADMSHRPPQLPDVDYSDEEKTR